MVPCHSGEDARLGEIYAAGGEDDGGAELASAEWLNATGWVALPNAMRVADRALSGAPLFMA